MNNMKLFYTKPAERFEESLAIGNGSLGAMILGDPSKEHLGLNEESLWSGYYHDKNNPDAINHLEEARRLIEQGKFKEAEKFIQKNMLGEYNETYLPLGDLFFNFKNIKNVTDYKRTLDIENSVAAVSFISGDCIFRREYFASYPSKAIFIKLDSEKPNLDFSVRFTSQNVFKTKIENDTINIKIKCPEHVDPNYIDSVNPVIQGTRGMEVSARLNLLYCDGEVENGETLSVSNAKTVIFSFCAVKPANILFSNDHKNPDILDYYENLKALHIKDYRKLYAKVEINLGEQKEIPTDERLKNLKNGEKDNGLYSLFFQYGRYLLISSSREGSLPANLQGIWSWQYRAPWSSNFTTNINVQMNYWPAQVCNLKECMPPYFELLKKLCEEGKKTAKIHFNCRGFCCNHNADYWCNTNPVGLAHGQTEGEDGCVTWSFWPMGGAWMTSELYKEYEYNKDKKFLRETAYPILREAALFFIDWLYLYKGKYVTCPSTSPENKYFTKEGDSVSVTMSSAMDLSLIREVFGYFKKTCAELDIDDEILPDLEERLERLTPFKIGSYGQILEWNEEFKETNPGQHHMSHLYGLFPSELFANDAKMTEAARIAFKHRMDNGGGDRGWSCAWTENLYAILGDGDNALKHINLLLKNSVFDNLWNYDSPFQIDANFGTTAAIANMLVQDRGGKVKILPALPNDWKSGYVKGLRIKNGKTVDIEWKDGKILNSRIY